MPDNPQETGVSPLGRTLLSAGAAVIVLAGMRAASPILGPVLIALVLTVAWSPASQALQKKGIPPVLAAAAGIVVGVLVVALLVVLVWVSLLQLQNRLPSYQPRVAALYSGFIAWLADLPIESEKLFSLETLDPGSVIGYVLGGIRRITTTAGNLLILVLLMAFMMIEAARFPEKLAVALASNSSSIERLTSFGTSIQRYIVLNAVFGLAAAAVNTAILLALGVDFAVLWGVLSFLLSFVPNIGFVISLVPPAALALLEFGVGRALVVVVSYTVINFFVDNVMKPRFVGQTLNLSPAVVVISLFFWGWLLGPLGALVAVPLSIGVRFLLDGYEETRWMSLLMRDRVIRRGDPDISSVAERAAQP